MFPQLYTAASGLIAGEQTLELVTGNLANIHTPAYRPDRPLFSAYMANAVAATRPGLPPAAPRGVVLASSWRPDEKGVLRETGDPLDLALAGPGWFRVATKNGERLTRVGSFTRSADGRLATTSGHPVLDDGGRPIVLPDGRVVISPDGSVEVDGVAIARLGIAKAESGDLVREGETLWKPSAAPASLDPSAIQVQQGYVEESAVNATVELVTLIQAQRMYEMQQHLLDVTANTIARRAIELGDPR